MNPIALVTCDDNPNYTEFEPIVKDFWSRLGFEPVCLKVGVDYPIVSGVATSLQAQILRLYAPTTFQDRIVILSDMDMLPLNRDYFVSKLPSNNDEFSIYSSDAYSNGRYPMCYIASRGQNYSIFKSDESESWESYVLRLSSLGYGWDTDELYMSNILNNSNKTLIKYERGWVKGIASNRFDRVYWDPNLEKSIDAHCPRPYSKYKSIIDTLKRLVR